MKVLKIKGQIKCTECLFPERKLNIEIKSGVERKQIASYPYPVRHLSKSKAVKTPMNFDQQIEKLKKNLEVILPTDGLEEKVKWSLKHNKPLRIKLGFDPTSPDLHLGHSVVLKKLRDFQECGHQIVVIIGDFTACIGDPTGRNKTRPPLTQAQIVVNADTYLDQLSKVIDLSKAEIHFNSKWFKDLNLNDLIAILSNVTISQILQRDDFNNRYKSNIPIYFHELMYPIIQGYDSYMIEADVEIGGRDQLFNCLLGRDIQSAFDKKQQIVLCLPILRGTDGQQKMSKSLDNAIGLTEEPHNIYGKIMSIPDDLLEEYARLVCDYEESLIKQRLDDIATGALNPMSFKKEIAFEILKQFCGQEAAKASEEHFYKQVQSRDDNLIEYEAIALKDLNLKLDPLTLLSLCSAIQKDRSKSELRRLIEGGGVTVNLEKITDPNYIIQAKSSESLKLKLGKRNYFQIALEQC